MAPGDETDRLVKERPLKRQRPQSFVSKGAPAETQNGGYGKQTPSADDTVCTKADKNSKPAQALGQSEV